MVKRSLRSWPRLVLVIVGLGVIAGIYAGWYAQRVHPEECAASRLAKGDPREAEAIYWRLLQREPVTLPRILGLVTAHASALAAHTDERSGVGGVGGEDGQVPDWRTRRGAAVAPFLDDRALDAFLGRADLPADAARLGRYWRQVLNGQVDPALARWVADAADREPPAADANRLLAAAAVGRADADEAARRYLREGRLVPGHAEDINQALAIYEDTADWAALADALRDPRVASHASPIRRARLAWEQREWLAVPRWCFLATYPRPKTGPLILTLCATFAWAWFCARLGKLGERPVFRGLVYLAAFVLGILSVSVTDLAILVEGAKLQLIESGDPLRDALFFVFGVGLREELSKLLLFAPLLPLLRRYGQKIDVLVAGAFVGLGFAAVENLSYLTAGDLGTGIGRFLSANFLHLAMTALLASGLDDFLTRGDDDAPELSRLVFMVVVLHGLYDFFISHPAIGGGYLSVLIFFFLVDRFLRAVDAARGRRAPDDRLLAIFAIGIAAVVAVSFVWAGILVGPRDGALALSGGVLGSGIMIFAFARRVQSL